jgi:hypothetical protein
MWQSHSVHQSSPSSDAIAGATKLQFNRRELDQAAAAQRAGEAIAYNELESKYSQPIVKFRSEITQERNKSVARVRHRVATHTCKLSHLLRDRPADCEDSVVRWMTMIVSGCLGKHRTMHRAGPREAHTVERSRTRGRPGPADMDADMSERVTSSHGLFS